MWELGCEESWVLKKWCFWTVVLEKTLESILDCKEIQPVHPKGDQSCVFIGRTDAEAETPILWPPHAKSWLTEKDPDAGRDWGQEEKGMTENEMAGWHCQLDEHEFESTSGVCDGQGGLACYDSWGRKELDMTERLNWIELNWILPSSGHVEDLGDTQLQSGGPRKLTCLDLPRGFISRRLSCLSLLGDLHLDLGMSDSQVVAVLGRISFRETPLKMSTHKREGAC